MPPFNLAPDDHYPPPDFRAYRPLPGDDVGECEGMSKVQLLIAIIAGILLVAIVVAEVMTTPGPSR